MTTQPPLRTLIDLVTQAQAGTLCEAAIPQLGMTAEQVHEEFMEGRCYALAIAHHRRYGWPIMVLGGYHDEDQRDDHRTISCYHALVKHPSGDMLDINGLTSADRLLHEWDDCELLPLMEAQLVDIVNDHIRARLPGDIKLASRVIDTYLKPQFPGVYEAQAGTLVEAAGSTIPDFMDHMIDAVSNAGFGFHFEEGGCWGMALAIHDKLRSLGHNPEIVVTKGNTHAMVRDAGRLYDHSGEAYGFSGRLRRLTPEALLALAGRCGVDEDQVMADKDAAAEIIEAAEELAQREAGTLTEAAVPTFFHGSRRPLKLGTVLRPKGMPDFEEEEQVTEDILERYRPDDHLPRQASVYLVANPEDIDGAGGSSNHVYVVEPSGTVERSDVGWWGHIYLNVMAYEDGDVSEDEMRQYAENYWNGVADKGRWEYRCPAAKVIRKSDQVTP